MGETQGRYTATVADSSDSITSEVDVRPPFTASKNYLDYCGDMNGTIVSHFVTTPETTRLTVTIADETVSRVEQDTAVQHTAAGR